MEQDAASHADEDRKTVELVNTRNQCDAMIHSVKKSLGEYGDKISADEKAAIEAAMKDAEEALKGNDKDTIEAKTKALAEASHKLAEKMYAEQQPGQAAGGGEHKAEDDNVVDAEFEEVKNDKK
jgi:molecular chaperone DnaK